jgi:hypothetical protein
MNRALSSSEESRPLTGHKPIGGFLDRLPTLLYVAAHVGFLAVGMWLWLRADDHGLPYSGALLLYAASQVPFLAFFGRAITMKLAVLTEQTLMFVMVLVIVLRATT